MAEYTFYALGESQITVSGGGALDGVTQGDGSHLVGRTITLNSKAFETITVNDNGPDIFFDDNDGNQRARVAPEDRPPDGIDFDGENYRNNTRIEAEYLITLRDPNTGVEYRAIAVNFSNSGPAYATVEGLAFESVIPPAGVALEVTGASEGPGDFGVAPIRYEDIAAPPCFTPGTRILTPSGERRIEDLSVGDLVVTLDHGPQPLRWIGYSDVGATALALSDAVRPIRIHKNAFGPGRPARDMLVSPQHRVLLEGWKAELLYGEAQVLVAAAHLLDDTKITRASDITETTYIHLQFDRHELIYSDGLLTESFNPGPHCLAALTPEAREELLRLFPEKDPALGPMNVSVRPLVTQREVKALGHIA